MCDCYCDANVTGDCAGVLTELILANSSSDQTPAPPPSFQKLSSKPKP
jgi:hypothetical protein